MTIQVRGGRGRIPAGLPLITAVLVAVGAGASGWAVRPQTQPAATVTRAARWRADLSYLSAQLAAQENPAAYAAGRADFSREIAALEARAGSASDAQMDVGVMEALASFGVAHTNLFDPPFGSYPIKLALFGDGFHVVYATAPYRSLLGALLVRIGDTPAMAAYQRVAAVIPHENQAWVSEEAPQYLTMPTILDGLGILANGHDDLAFRTSDGASVTVSLPTVPFGEYPQLDSLVADPPLYLQHLNEPFWYTYLPAEQTIYVRYLKCMDPEAFATLTDQVFNFAANHPVRRLVVDFRLNGGGSTAVFAPFLERLQASSLDKSARVYAVIDQGTFSSGMGTAIEPTFAQYAAGDDPVMDAILAK